MCIIAQFVQKVCTFLDKKSTLATNCNFLIITSLQPEVIEISNYGSVRSNSPKVSNIKGLHLYQGQDLMNS